MYQIAVVLIVIGQEGKYRGVGVFQWTLTLITESCLFWLLDDWLNLRHRSRLPSSLNINIHLFDAPLNNHKLPGDPKQFFNQTITVGLRYPGIMAALRTTPPSIATIFRFASQPPATRRCAHCLKAQRCPFSSFRPALQSSKRPLMTETARPQTLEPEMPPPRNEGTPETSISTGDQTTWPPTAPWERKDSGAGVSEREGEAQKSKPTVAGQQMPAASTAVSPKKSKLRPRKAPITLTPHAVTQLQALFDQPESKMIRVGVKNRGCSGLAYHLEYVEKPGAFDEAVEQDGVKVLIDSKALFSIIGSEMDWMEDKLSARFVFRNPNISKFALSLVQWIDAILSCGDNADYVETAEQCGCGESFSVSQ